MGPAEERADGELVPERKSAPSGQERRSAATNVDVPPATTPRLLALLEQVRPALPSALLDDDGAGRLAALASLLPLDLSSFWGLAFRLGRREARADLLLAVAKRDPGMALLAGASASCVDPLCETWPAWRDLRVLAGRALDDRQPLHRHVRNLWLEFDLAEAASPDDLDTAVRRPNLFVGPEPSSSGDEIAAAVGEVMALLGRSRPGPARLQWFLDALPAGASVFQVGLMLTRVGDAGLRLCVNQVAPEVVRPWLAALLPSDAVDGLSSLVDQLDPLTHAVALGFHLTDDGIAPTIGLECHPDWLHDDSARWSPLLAFLTRRGLCNPEKVAAVQRYPGTIDTPLLDRLPGSAPRLPTFRSVHRVKCTLTPDRIAEAKAYLSVSRPRAPRLDPGAEPRRADQIW